jgi:hypothetical protein
LGFSLKKIVADPSFGGLCGKILLFSLLVLVVFLGRRFLLNPGIPQNRLAAQARTEEINLELGRAAGTKILVVFTDVRLARG